MHHGEMQGRETVPTTTTTTTTTFFAHVRVVMVKGEQFGREGFITTLGEDTFLWWWWW